ncbi:MAG: glycosyltransferase, partial [Desulfuromonadaceae bacterium]
AKSRFVAAGFSARKIAVKPNFYAEKKGSAHSRDFGNRSGALYVGRLSAEKGIRTLLRAWSELTVPLWVAGGGPLLDEVQHCETETLHCLGQLGADQVATEMSRAVFLVLPSECYENFPLTLAEAFAHGLPVIASRLGAMAEIVEDGVTGLHFEPGDAADLAAKVRWLNDHPEECRQMGCNARREFEAKYTPERNYDMLLKIYQEAIDEHQKRRQS